ncbi:MAG TPA: cytochrome c biogenesis protein CcdA [Candidatus Dormibacteraeota bacterium]|nr:cytochrome c biogenesis protein CcdA [Candidatus Dormibacteraeota bacterium]
MPALTIHLSYPLALLAGLVSFLSPCVFPLAPAYLAYLGGRAGEPVLVAAGGGTAVLAGDGDAALRRVNIVANGIAFVLGFSAVFITFFYVFTALNVTLFVNHRHAITVAAGVIVLVLGLQTLGLFRIGWLMRERRMHIAPRGFGLAPSFALGVSFAAGWTPCIGPQLGSILNVAQQGDFAGLPVMVIYCLGLAVPFLLMAALTDRLQPVVRAVNRHMGAINLVAGCLLLLFGLLLVSDRFTYFNGLSPQSPFDL